jgi:hypothetical protein
MGILFLSDKKEGEREGTTIKWSEFINTFRSPFKSVKSALQYWDRNRRGKEGQEEKEISFHGSSHARAIRRDISLFALPLAIVVIISWRYRKIIKAPARWVCVFASVWECVTTLLHFCLLSLSRSLAAIAVKLLERMWRDCFYATTEEPFAIVLCVFM